MAQLIELSNGERLEFPDEMTEEQMHEAIQRNYPMDKYADSGFPESKGWTGVASDALAKGLQSAFAIPGAIAAAPGEIYGAGSQIFGNPKRVLQNVGGGFGELGHGILSAPGNIRDYLARKDIVSQDAPSFRLPKSVLPKEYGYAEALGRQGSQPGDALLESIPGAVASAPFASKVASAFSELPLTKGMAAKSLVKADKLIEERGLKGFTIPKDTLKEINHYMKLPGLAPSKVSLEHALKGVQKGEYKPFFALQSNLGHISRELSKSSSGVERLLGHHVGDLRTKMLSDMQAGLEKRGHKDIGDLIARGQNKYRQHIKIKPVIKSATTFATGAIAGPQLGKIIGKMIF